MTQVKRNQIDTDIINGWISANEAWTYASADAPTFVITVPSGAASKYNVGDKIKLTQTTVKYFIITAITDTTLTVYGGTDYTLANAAISANYYSHAKSPVGFPMTKEKWSVSLTDTSQRSQGSVVSGTWYNAGSLTLTIPIGVWDVSIFLWPRYSGGGNAYAGLSTANNTAGVGLLSFVTASSGVSFGHSAVSRNVPLTLTSKQAYYLNVMTDSSGGGTLYIDGASTTTAVNAVCAYL